VLIETFTQPSEYVERVYDGLDKLFNEYKDAWKDQSDRQVESKQVAKQIIEDKEGLVKFLTPEAKGRLIAILCRKYLVKEVDGEQVWDMEEEQEEAIIVILSWIQSRSEARRVFKNVKEESATEVSETEGRTKVYKALDGRESLEFAKWQYYWFTQMPDKVEKKDDKVSVIKQWDLSIF